MRRARADLPVELWATTPIDGFLATPALTRTVLDLGAFAEPRALPLIGDILQRLQAASRAQWLIYTNADIALGCDFYCAVEAELDSGADALVINRRTVPQPDAPPSLEWLLSQPGEPHPGYDCFVWRRPILEGVDFRGVCVGFPPVGRVLLAALSSRARNFQLLTDRRLTFHLGDDKPWQSERYLDYWRHNQREALGVLDGLGALSPLAATLRSEIAAQEQL